MSRTDIQVRDDYLAVPGARFRLDQRGRGKSSPGVDPGDVSIDSEVAALDCVRRHLGLEAISLRDHSWGGVLAMEYAVRHPDRVACLILMNSAPGSHADWLILLERLRAGAVARGPACRSSARSASRQRRPRPGSWRSRAAGHFALLDRPGEVFDAVVNFCSPTRDPG